MRVILIIAALLLVAVSAAAVAPDAGPIRPYLSQVTLALAILVLIGAFWQPRQRMPPLAPAALPSAFTPYSATAAKFAIVSIRSGLTPSSRARRT